MKEAKTKELRDLKRNDKTKQEATKFELRYKKVKFIEKRKVIRHLEHLGKELKQAGVDEERLKELREAKKGW